MTIEVSPRVKLRIERHPIREGGADYSRRMIEKKRWMKWREEVFKQDEYKCRTCGATEDLIPHHIKPFVSNPKERYDPKYGRTFCRKHHGELGEKQYALGILNPRNPPDAIQLPLEIKIGPVKEVTKLRMDRFRRIWTSLKPKGNIYPLFYFHATLSRDIVWVWNEADPGSFLIGIPGILLPAEASDEELLQLLYPHFKESFESVSKLSKDKKEYEEREPKELYYLLPLFQPRIHKNGK